MNFLNLKSVSVVMLGLVSSGNVIGQISAVLTNNSGSAASAIGFGTTATGIQSTAMGSGTTASGTHSTSMGSGTLASGNQSTAIGFNSQATGLQSFAVGHWSYATAQYSFALGARAYGTGDHAMAIGVDVRGNGNRSMVIGSGVGNTSANALHNNIGNSLMVGFNSTIPTFYIGPSSGANTIGNVGIGTSAPAALLDVRGVAANPSIHLTNATNNYLQMGISDCNGCFTGSSTPGDAVVRVFGGGDLIFSIPGSNGSRQIAFETAGARVMTVQEIGTSGKVGIGTTNFPATIGGANISAYNLYVRGGILTEELRVRTGWADYVFKDDYQLKSLTEVEEFIEKNGHLPNVPSGAQVEEEGIEMGEITRIQQEKIEELTLYVIELQKQLNQLNEEFEAMKK